MIGPRNDRPNQCPGKRPEGAERAAATRGPAAAEVTSDVVAPERAAAVRCLLQANIADLAIYLRGRVALHEDVAALLGRTVRHAWQRAQVAPLGDPARQRLWLFTVTAHVLAHYRIVDRRPDPSPRSGRGHPVARLPTPPATASAARNAVVHLRIAQQELLVLIHWDGLTMLDAAEILGATFAHARGRYAAARAALQSALSAIG